ncbi:isoprenylcysteine carboxyl methyltransferase family protein [Bacillus sp. YC2]|uniref:isoprenylcysteine carboxyl methyltransferase family protein n=1 Tax=Bacillus sp. YC2 TaxID=2861287 RepID=UPI001CA63047|nr:isoprenylcysteine carboxyl methyltransferase family protein [Bacillus sp. YC2]MBY8914097.1 isoprenylcysteine carboxyl methyltransferase family protein [Bacillus sp. YC2]
MFWLFILLLAAQRIAEMAVARQNERKVKKQGAIEYGEGHYPFLVLMHVLFFISLIGEVSALHKEPSHWWAAIAAIILFVQGIRYWALLSLGRYWNTKILVVPDAVPVKKGPYKWMKHPNYAVVVLEFIFLPLLYGAYWTLFIFSILNACILTVRIRAEDKALEENTAK